MIMQTILIDMASISTCVTTNVTCSAFPNLINIDQTHIKLRHFKTQKISFGKLWCPELYTQV